MELYTGNRYAGMSDEDIFKKKFVGTISKAEQSAYSGALSRLNQKMGSLGSLEDFESFTSGGGNPFGSVLWKGGKLTPEQYSKVQSLEKDRLLDEYQSKYAEAKSANESRYQEILGGYDKLLGDSKSMLSGMGDAEKADLMHNYDVLGSRQQQGLVNSGLSSTTIRPAVQAQNATAMQRALSLVNERLQGQQLNTMTGLTQDKLGVMERRDDTYPEWGQYMDLLQQYGNA